MQSPHPPALPALPIEELRARVAGTVATPGTADYDRIVTPWNLAVEVRPALAPAAASDEDVVQAVRYAGRHGLRVTPQATGHGPIASLVGELLVSTAGLDECTVHPDGWARVGGGVKWGRIVEAAAPLGLAPLSGSSTGDGQLRRVTPTEEPELFFALRGGKGMLGIVTAIEFDLVRQPTFHGGAVWFDGDHAHEVVAQWRSWSEQLPEAGTTSFALFRLPAMPGVPPVLADRLTIAVRYVWTGDDEEGARRFAPMRSVAPALVDDIGTKPYTAIDSVHADPVDPMPFHEGAVALSGFPAEAATALLDAAGPDSGSPQVMVEVRRVGGAVAPGATNPDAICARDISHHVLTIGVPQMPGTVEHATATQQAMAPWAHAHRLPNFTSHASDYPTVYDAATTTRLLAAIDRYDPHGVIAIGHALRG